jgi:hypothetical protein
MLRLLLALTLAGLQVTIQSPAGCHPCYVQIDPSAGATASPQIFQFDLNPGESFGHTVEVGGSGSVRVRVWTEMSGQDADADQTIQIATHRIYLPIF